MAVGIGNKANPASTPHRAAGMRLPITHNSRPGQAIYDLFLGSGTSLFAAEMTGCICWGVEVNPAYVDVSVRRWQVFTGGLLQSGRNASVDCIPHEPASRRRSSVAVSRKLPPWWLPRRVRRRPGPSLRQTWTPKTRSLMFVPVDVLMAYPTGLLTGPCDRSSGHRGRLRRRWGQSDRRESYTGSG
jgi:hypothetical protein